MAPPDRAEVMRKLRAWLASKKPGLEADAIDETTDIVETRMLESLQTIEFVLFLENETGASILSEDMDMSSIRTLARIYETYFAGTER